MNKRYFAFLATFLFILSSVVHSENTSLQKKQDETLIKPNEEIVRIYKKRKLIFNTLLALPFVSVGSVLLSTCGYRVRKKCQKEKEERDKRQKDDLHKKNYQNYLNTMYKIENGIYTPLKGNEEDHRCPICFEDLKGEKVCLTPCKHVFCRGCLERWFDKNLGDIFFPCPVCRKEIHKEIFAN
jgi:hypothetical protein